MLTPQAVNGDPDEAICHHPFDTCTIGLALGSPRQGSGQAIPKGEQDDMREHALISHSNSTTQSGSSVSTDVAEGSRWQGKNWKKFGGLIRSKVLSPVSPPSTSSGSDPQPRIYLREQPEPSFGKLPQASLKSEESENRRKRSLRKILSEKQIETALKPATLRSRTVPQVEVESWRQRPIKEEREEIPVPPLKNTRIAEEPATLRTFGGSLLEVEIPSIQLERVGHP